MAKFRYVAIDMSGKVHRGTKEAQTENALTLQLKSEGLFIISMKNLTEGMSYKKLKSKKKNNSLINLKN